MTESDFDSPRRRRAAFRLTLTGFALMMAGASAPSPFYPALRAEIGFSAGAMTGIFAIYAAALLATLLVAGNVSDHLGRRPVLSAGFALLAASMVGFMLADSVTGLLLARVGQGVASGLLMATLTATTTDHEPQDRPGHAAVWNAVAPLGGLAIGALFAGVVMDDLPAPRLATFAVLSGAYALFAVLVWWPPETVARRAGLVASLRPRIAVPHPARGAFSRAVPAVIASWATGGLFLSLGAPIVGRIFGETSVLAQGATVTALAGTGALSVYLSRNRAPRQVAILGADALALGTILSLLALQTGVFGLYLASVIVAGVGFGTAFSGVIRTIAPTVAAHERGALFAALFTVSYTAFGLPALLAGLAVPLIGLGPTATAYGVGIVALAFGAGVLRRRAVAA